MALPWKGAYPLNKASSSGDNYQSPDTVFEHYNRLYGFYMDVCASKENAKVRRYYTKEANALQKDWIGPVWMNPPYGDILSWARKAHEESLRGATVVALLPAHTGSTWFHAYAVPYAHITFLKRRQQFVSPAEKTYRATFPSMVAVWPRSAAIKSPTAKRLTVDIDDI